MTRRVGVDEAGRGPVLGSMFAAAVRVPDPGVLPDGLDDSKQLPADRRESLAAALREHADVAVGVAEVSVERIDDPETDMNALGVHAQATAIERAIDGQSDGTDEPRVLADACDTDEDRFARRVADGVESSVAVTAEHGADGRHEVVAAASILAKVERDAHVAALADDHDELIDEHGGIGSGYPSDPNTRAFLESYVDEHGSVPPFARSSWKTCQQLLAEREQRGLGDF